MRNYTAFQQPLIFLLVEFPPKAMDCAHSMTRNPPQHVTETLPLVAWMATYPWSNRVPRLGGSPGYVGGACDVGEATSEGLENEQSLIRQHFRRPLRRFTYVTAYSPIVPASLQLRHKHFTYVTWRAAHGSKKAIYKVGPSFVVKNYVIRDDYSFSIPITIFRC